LDTKKFRPHGGDIEKSSDFQLVCATNMDLEKAVRTGAFRKDLLARIQLWSFELLGLKERPEDIEPNLDYELERWNREEGKRVRMSREVRAEFLRFAMSPEAKWTTNFRDLRGIVERMATLAEGGIITPAVLKTEMDRIKQRWAREGEAVEGSDAILRSLMGEDRLAKLDLIDRIQLSGVIQVCRECRSAAEAARKLFAASRDEKTNDSDRITKYLKQFGLHFSDCSGRS
jgi:transcriptional regulatory protein RtcR